MWLKDQSDQEAFDRIYRGYFSSEEALPTRTRMHHRFLVTIHYYKYGWLPENGDAIESSHYEYVTLKMLQSTGNTQKKHLISFTKDFKMDEKSKWSVGNETYSNLLEINFCLRQSFLKQVLL